MTNTPVLAESPHNIHQTAKEAVVDSLLGNLSARLAGRGEYYRWVIGAKPSRALLSEFIVPMPEPDRTEDAEADPIRISAHGLDLQVDANALTTPFSVSVTGAVYVRVLPTSDEVKPGGPLNPSFPLTPETHRDLRGRIREGLKALAAELGGRDARKHKDWFERSQLVRKEAHGALGLPFGDTVDRLPDEAPDDVPKAEKVADDSDAKEDEEETGDDAPPPASTSADGSGSIPDNRVLEVPPPQKWLRLDLKLPTFVLTLATADADVAAATKALKTSIDDQLKAWAASSDPTTGGKLWGFRHGRNIRPSDTGKWNSYLESVRASSLEAVLPNIELQWKVQITEDSLDPTRRTVHLALENWSRQEPANRLREFEQTFFHLSVSVELPTSAHRWLRLDRVKPSYRYNRYLKYPALGFNGGVVYAEASSVTRLTTTWTPRYVLPRIVATELKSRGVDANIQRLAREDSLDALKPLVNCYADWLKEASHTPVEDGMVGQSAEAIAAEKEKLRQDGEAWTLELRAIQAGLSILEESRNHWKAAGPQSDPRAVPFEAWVAMNDAMAIVAKGKGYADWRLFQLVFILSSIPAFVTRMPQFESFYTPEVAEHSNAVTLLYFATGGGKSEAFLGLLVYVLLLDRLRGKHHGVSALMRYPLRLLTLQQAQRTLRTLAAAETVRFERKHPGEILSLGFWVGSSNTPNWHQDPDVNLVPKIDDAGIDEEPALLRQPAYVSVRERWLKITTCPFCAKDSTALRRFPVLGNALGHVCTSPKSVCSWNKRFAHPQPLPVYIVDEDIYDFAPSVLLGTVDKLAAIGQSQGTIRRFFGMFGFAPLIANDSSQRLFIPRKRADWTGEPGVNFTGLFPTYPTGTKRFFDPFPSLLIQDEAHLLDESLGTFAGLFESALEAAFDTLAPMLGKELSFAPGTTTRRRIKVIAASATVNEPQRQMKSLYQRTRTVQFPHPGPSLYSSFYASPMAPDSSEFDADRRLRDPSDEEGRSHWARVYQAQLTNGHRHTVAMAGVLAHFHLAITELYEELRSGDSIRQGVAKERLLRWLPDGPLKPQFVAAINACSASKLLALVFLHRISLTYVTNKKGGDQVIETERLEFDRLHEEAGFPAETRIESDLISGAVDAAGIQRIVNRAQERPTPNKEYPELGTLLRSIVATSAVSHGVDVDEFNSMFFAGMPSDIAEYIQASSRVGRTHVGFSLLVPIPQRSRDRFIVEIHDIFHRFLERMILPAATDRWAEKALVRVLPSFFQEYVCGVRAISNVVTAATTAEKATCPSFVDAMEVEAQLKNPLFKDDLVKFLGSAIGLDVSPAPDGAPHYRSLIKQQVRDIELGLENARLANSKLRYFLEKLKLGQRPMTSLRDVDEPGLIVAGAFDAMNRRTTEEAVGNVMQFIRRGTGADVDDTNPALEAKD